MEKRKKKCCKRQKRAEIKKVSKGNYKTIWWISKWYSWYRSTCLKLRRLCKSAVKIMKFIEELKQDNGREKEINVIRDKGM